jgi:hypothetical protein
MHDTWVILAALALMTGSSLLGGCGDDNPFGEQCLDSCALWSEDCGENQQLCDYDCEDPVLAGGISGCMQAYLDGEFDDSDLPHDTICGIITDCIEDARVEYGD